MAPITATGTSAGFVAIANGGNININVAPAMTGANATLSLTAENAIDFDTDLNVGTIHMTTSAAAINIYAPIAWSANTLTLTNRGGAINMDAALTATDGTAGLVLKTLLEVRHARGGAGKPQFGFFTNIAKSPLP